MQKDAADLKRPFIISNVPVAFLPAHYKLHSLYFCFFHGTPTMLSTWQEVNKHLIFKDKLRISNTDFINLNEVMRVEW